jgi:hypothetical protein
LRGDYRYENGELVEASGWTETGARLGEKEARQVAEVDRLLAEKAYTGFEREVADHMPLCP